MSEHKDLERGCSHCHPPTGGTPTNLNLRMPLLAQCQSPIDHPPHCNPCPGQVLLAIECGSFFYWGKVLVDEDDDGDIDSSHYEWLPVKCGECAPISFRQSQIFFYDCFTGVETVTGPTLGIDCPPAVPKPGDYLIDCATHNVWLYAQDSETQVCGWMLKENCFGSSLITINKSTSPVAYNCTTQKFEICYNVTVCNVADRDFSQVSITDDVHAQAIAAGLSSPTITFLSPTDMTFVESTFASSNSNVLVLDKPLAAYSCKTIEYRVSSSTWTQNSACLTEFVNTATVTKAMTTMGKNLAFGQSAKAKTILSVFNVGSYGSARLEKKFGPSRVNTSNNTITSTVPLTVCNSGGTPITLNSLIDDVKTTLGSSAFSQPGTPSARWVCGTGSLPSINASYDGNSQTNLLSGTFLLASGQCFAVDFDLTFQQSILVSLTASAPFVNIATLSFTDMFGQTMQCTARDTFYCDECPQLSVQKDVEYIRYKKQRIDLFVGVPFNDSHQYEIAYEVSLKFTIINTGCITITNIVPYLNIEDYMIANGVINGQRGVVFNALVTIVDKFPGSGPSITANGSFTGTNDTLAHFNNRLISQTNLALQPGQGFNINVKYDYVPSNNSRKGVVDVSAPQCVYQNISGDLPALQGAASLLVQYEAICQNGVQSINLSIPLESRDCPNITLEKQTVQLMDLSDRFTQTTDVYFQLDAFASPIEQTPTFVAGPTYIPPISPSTTTIPPPPTYNCYQATFKYKVTNSGNVPLDQIRICDDFFDQLIEDFGGGGPSAFCGYYVVCPPPVLVAGPARGDDGSGFFGGHGGWTGLKSGDTYLGGGDAMLLPGTSIEFSVVVRFCIDPKVSIRLRNDARVLARGPNEVLVYGESRGFIPIIGPSLCFSKEWAPGYPLQIVGQDGYFKGQLVYTVYNDGDRRVLDVEVIDEFTSNVYTVITVDNVNTAPDSIRQRVMPCSTISNESPTNPVWTGTNTTAPVNTPPLPYLDRSESFTVYTPTFTFRVDSINASAQNTATVNGHTIYDNPALNTTKTLPQLRAYSGYSGVGDDLKFGLLCRHSTIDVDPSNFFRTCPLPPQNLVLPAIAHTAQLVSSTPGNVLYDITYTLPYENSNGGSIVNVARVNFIQITSN